MKILGIIPARFSSTRLPGKPLLDLGGKPMVQWVYEAAIQVPAFDKVVVATDDARILDAVHDFGGNAILTDVGHISGTDRCQEVVNQENEDYDYIVNIQGDEPFISVKQLSNFCKLLDGETQIASQYLTLNSNVDPANPNLVKVVINQQHEALYFSRSTIPFKRNPTQYPYLQHIGLYGYRKDILESITVLEPSVLEQTESLEQLRWLDAGYSIRMQETKEKAKGIDTPADLDEAREWLKSQES